MWWDVLGAFYRAACVLKPEVSNEPGLYLEGRFGIRIENLMLVVKKAPKFIRCVRECVGGWVCVCVCVDVDVGVRKAMDKDGRSYLGLRPITVVPIQTLIKFHTARRLQMLVFVSYCSAPWSDAMSPRLRQC